MKSNLTMPDWETARLQSRRFALLAQVGREQRKASGYLEEAEFYSTSATEALALLEDALVFLRKAGDKAPAVLPLVNEFESRQRQLIRQLLNHWSNDMESQKLRSKVLDSAGVVSRLDTTPEGYYSLSTDHLLRSLEQILEA